MRSTLTPDEKNIASTSVYENGYIIKTDFFEYDAYGNVVCEKKQLAENEYSVIRYLYSEKTHFVFPDSTVYENVYDASGKVRNVTVSAEYDKFGNVLSATDGEGNITRYTYDKLGRLLTETLADGSVRSNVYIDNKNVVKATDAENTTLIYQYDSLGREIRVTEESTGNVLTEKAYTSDGLVDWEKDALGTLYSYGYSVFRELASLNVSDSSGTLTETRYRYDAAYPYGGKLYRMSSTEILDGNSVRRNIQLSDFRDLLMYDITISGEKERITSMEYDYAGNAVKMTAPGGAVVNMEHDSLGNKINETSGNITVHYGYDLAGNLLYQTNGEGETTTYEYDGFGNTVKVTVPYVGKATATQKTYYDNNGNVVKTVSAEGVTVETEYDSWNNPVKITSGSSVTVYEYDKEGRVIAQSQLAGDGRKITTSYTYDVFGNVVTSTDNLGQTVYYTYDPAGNLIKTVDRNGTVLYNEYDGLSRVLRSYNTLDKSETKYTYNGFGELVRVDDGGIITEYTYNGFGELILEKSGGISKEYAYDIDGNRTLFRLLNGGNQEMRTEYAYDELNRLKRVKTPIGEQVYYYDKADRVTGMLNDNTGEETVYTYYPSGAVKNIITKHNGKETDRLYYEYDKDGNRTLELGSNAIKQYTYDEQGRLKKSITDLNYVTGYEYDDFNNISVARTLYGGVMTSVYYEYDGNNRLISTTDEYNVTTYEYDNNGNMIRSDGEETADYVFNGAGELTEVWQDNSVYSYEYDHTGLRTSKTVDSVTTSMITDGMYVVAEYVGANSAYYYRGINLIGYTSAEETAYYRMNAHGDVVAVVDGFGETLKTYKYDAFGKQEEDGNEWLKILFGVNVEDSNPFRYCAEYYDEETEFIYLRARYYSPEIQRFISEDPIKDGINWYAYCGNNPIVFIDYTGLIVTKWDKNNLSEDEIKEIEDCTWVWEYGNSIDDQNLMDFAHNYAEKIRNKYRAENEISKGDGNTETIFTTDIMAITANPGKNFPEIKTGSSTVGAYALFGALVLVGELIDALTLETDDAELNQYDYYIAKISKEEDGVILGPPLSLIGAVRYALLVSPKSRVDGIMAVDDAAAKKLMAVLGGPARPNLPEIHGEKGNYYFHYHPKVKPHLHIWIELYDDNIS